MSEVREVSLEDLKFGDLISVFWCDASELAGELPKDEIHYEQVIETVGYFLGLKGVRKKHIIIGMERLPYPEWHITSIPVGMELRIILWVRGAFQKLYPKYWKRARRIVRRTSLETLRGAFKPECWRLMT